MRQYYSPDKLNGDQYSRVLIALMKRFLQKNVSYLARFCKYWPEDLGIQDGLKRAHQENTLGDIISQEIDISDLGLHALLTAKPD